LTPKKYNPARPTTPPDQQDRDSSVRTVLYEAAPVMLTKRSRAVRIEELGDADPKRAGMSKAKVRWRAGSR